MRRSPTPIRRRYLRSWGRAGDLGVIAEDASGPIGAAWCRLLPASEPGYGFVAEDVPEISIAVLAEHRGEGVGRRLLTALIEDASSHGVRALSLSVHVLNPVALHIYERAGFVRVGGTDTMRVMLLTLPAGRLPTTAAAEEPRPMKQASGPSGAGARSRRPKQRGRSA